MKSLRWPCPSSSLQASSYIWLLPFKYVTCLTPLAFDFFVPFLSILFLPQFESLFVLFFKYPIFCWVTRLLWFNWVSTNFKFGLEKLMVEISLIISKTNRWGSRVDKSFFIWKDFLTSSFIPQIYCFYLIYQFQVDVKKALENGITSKLLIFNSECTNELSLLLFLLYYDGLLFRYWC